MPKAKTRDPNELNASNIAGKVTDESETWQLLEGLRWPHGPVCPHCRTIGDATFLDPNQGLRTTRTGQVTYRRVWQCNSAGCRKQFSVLVGSVMEDSRIPVSKWLMALHMICIGNNGVSARELHRALGITYKSAWLMAHRIRYAMERPAPQTQMGGVVEVDGTYVGGKASGKRGRGTANKTPVVTLVQRDGEARSRAMKHVTGENARNVLRENVRKDATLMTDQYQSCTKPGAEFARHETDDHSKGEHARGKAQTNTAEDFFSQLKRSINGSYHHVSEQHLGRCLAEFDFRYNSRKVWDGERVERTVGQFAGRRLMYRESFGTCG
jgi:transposase-like protein